MNYLQYVFLWLQANAAWLQVVAAIIQSLAAVVAIYITLRAADRSVRLAFELNEEKENEKLQGQTQLLCFSLGLEIDHNIDDLRRFYDNFTLSSVEEQGANAATPEEREARRRFIALNIPNLSYRFWHSQQLSSLLPQALTRAQIRDVNRIYSDFDRLSKISRTFEEEALWRDKAALRHSGEAAVEGVGLSSLANELDRLLDEFEVSLRDVLDKINPLADSVTEGDEDKYISEGADRSRRALQSGRSTRSGVDPLVKE